jgi:hypothetical protein
MFLNNLHALKEGYNKLGAFRFFLMITATLSWIGFGVWLLELVEWPERFGFYCRGKGCWIEHLWNSPALIGHGFAEYALFAYFWSMPTAVLGAFVWALIRKRRNRILPLKNELE